MKQILLLVVSVLLLSSCSSNERMVKKFVSRINADEYDASSVYIFPDDRAKLDFFARKVKQRCKTTFFKGNDCETSEENGEEAVKVVFQVENANDFIRTYFEQIGKPLAADNTFTDVIPIRETKDGECLAFTWALPGVDGSHLMVASIQSGNNVSNMNIRRGPGTKYPIEGTLGRG